MSKTDQARAGQSRFSVPPSAQQGSRPEPAPCASRWRALWERHHLAAAALGCTVFLIAGGLAQRFHAAEGLWKGLYVLAYISGGMFSLRDALTSLVEKRRIDVDMLMVMAAAAAAAIGEWLEGGILLFLFSLSNALQHYAMDRTRRAITALMSARPREALLLEPDGTTRQVSIEELQIGDRIVVRPGELVPIDGVILAGTSSLDEASITGESIPVDKSVGDSVYGGTLNQNGALEVQVTKLASDTVLAKVIELVEQAQSEEAPTQRRIDTIEQYYALGVIGMTVLAAVIPILLGHDVSEAVYRAITLMVVASPCAVAMAVPAPVVSAIANGARSGILFKGGVHIENLADVAVIAFDKTGTLTEGRPVVTDIISFGNWTEDELLSLSAGVESHSEHPLARAILQAATAAGVEPAAAADTQAWPGMGVSAQAGGRAVWVGNHRMLAERTGTVSPDVLERAEELEAQGKTVMFAGVDDDVIGLFAVVDRLRPGVPEMIANLKGQGIRHVVMLTGDNERVAQAIAREAGVDAVYAGLLPAEKAEIALKLRNQLGTVAMVGDGVNDAPALAHATVGIAMGAAGTDVTVETADVVLMSNDLSKLNHAVTLSRRTKRIMWQNIVFALGVIAVLVLLVLTRGLVLSAGVVGHEGSTILVVFNSLRLLFGQHRSAQSESDKVPACNA